MMKNGNVVKFTTAGLATLAIASVLALGSFSYVAYAAPQASNRPGGNGGGFSSSSVSYTGATEISSDTDNSNQNYDSTSSAQNALLVSGGTSTLTNPVITKTGATSDENSDFYGTNAAVLVYNGATLNIKGGTVTTNAGHANGVFAYGSGTINISDATIKTTANNSGAIMVTGGGTLTATNVTATTDGNSSAPIRSDRGGGTLTVNGGSYTANGVGSPAIYSTADVIVKDATLVSTKSEGVVIEGLNSVTLENTSLTDTNTTLNGNSETYKNVFIYQSMSGDATVGTGTFTAKNSILITNKGDDFFITNTTAVINLTNTTITNNDGGAFLRAQTGKWGSSGSNGGKVLLNADNQEMLGDIVIDSISTLAMKMSGGSYYKGVINGDNTAKSIAISLSNDSVIVLDGDSYITSLTNADATNANIYLNGHKLYVNGVAVNGNNDTPPTAKTGGDGEAADIEGEDVDDENNVAVDAETETLTDEQQSSLRAMVIVLGAVGVVIVLAIIGLIVLNVSKKKRSAQKETERHNLD